MPKASTTRKILTRYDFEDGSDRHSDNRTMTDQTNPVAMVGDPIQFFDPVINGARASKEPSDERDGAEEAAELAACIAYLGVVWLYRHRKVLAMATRVCLCGVVLADALILFGIL